MRYAALRRHTLLWLGLLTAAAPAFAEEPPLVWQDVTHQLPEADRPELLGCVPRTASLSGRASP